MNKQILFIVGILCLTLMSANLVITDNPKGIDVKINQNQSFQISVLNNYSFPIYDLAFENLNDYGFEFPSNITINPSETKSVLFDVKTSSSYHGQLNSNVKFNYLVDLPEEITNYNIYISNSGFDLDYLTVRAGDTISFTNEDSIVHSIHTDTGTINVAPNSTQTTTFSNIGTFNIYDENFQAFSFFNAQIQVVSRTESQKVHNPNYDQTWYINLESNLNPTTLQITNSQNDYNITNKKTKNGQFEIKNNGSEIAEIVKISADKDWIVFNTNNLNIQIDDTEWIGYQLIPYFLNTNDTDKTYSINVKIKASNSIEYNQTILVYIPFQEVTDSLENDFDFAMWLQNSFCPTHPCSVQCSPELPQCQNNGTGYGNGTGVCSLNLTEQSWYETQRKIAELSDANNRQINLMNEYKELYGGINESTNDLSNGLEKTTKNQKEITTIIGIIFFSIIIFGLVLWKIKNWNKRTEQQRRGKLSTKWHED